MKRAILALLLILLGVVVWLGFFHDRPPGRLETHLPPQAVEVLEGAEQMTLLSLDPGPFPPGSSGEVRFHANIILGETLISQPEQRRQIARELQQVVSASDGTLYMCFNPRHGLRVTRGAKTYDFLICYECGRVDTFVGEEEIASTSLSGAPRLFNDILRAAHIPLAPSPEEMAEQMKKSEDTEKH